MRRECLTIIGTAHVSAESVEEVKDAIYEHQPDVVAIELDRGRYTKLKQEMMGIEQDDTISVTKIIKENKVGLFFTTTLLSYFQSKVGAELDVAPGSEMVGAIEAAEDLGCNGPQVFSRVILPLSIPGILSGFTMVFVPAVSTFYISQKLGNAETILIGDIIERQFKQGQNPNLGSALSLVLMLLVLVCTGIINRFGSDEEGGVVA